MTPSFSLSPTNVAVLPSCLGTSPAPQVVKGIPRSSRLWVTTGFGIESKSWSATRSWSVGGAP